MILPWHRSSLIALLARRDRLPHALLISGPQGIGKLAWAMALAQALLCERPVASSQACGTCPGCLWFGQGSHPDFRLLEPHEPEDAEEAGEGRQKKASLQITVHQVRALQNFIFLTTHRGGARVALIHPAESLNIHAANALLKNLEEPPARTYFLLVAHRWHQLLATIRSRCQQVPLPLPEIEPALAWLKSQGLAQPELALAQAGGAPLLAAQFDDQYWQLRERLLARIAAPELDPLAAADALHDTPPARIVALLQKWSFDIVLQKAADKVRYNPDRAQAVVELAAQVDPLAALRFHRRMVCLQRVVHHPLNARLFLEDLFLGYAELLRTRNLRRVA